MVDGSSASVLKPTFEAEIKPELRRLILGAQHIETLCESLFCDPNSAETGADLSNVSSDDGYFEILEQVQRVAMLGIRDAIAYRYFLLTGTYATEDDIEFFLPDEVQEFDPDELLQSISQTAECWAAIDGTYVLVTGEHAEDAAIEKWRASFARGDATLMDVRRVLEKNEHAKKEGFCATTSERSGIQPKGEAKDTESTENFKLLNCAD